MTIISQTATLADVQAAPRAKTRNASLDRTRTFLTLVVLLHHAVIPYTYFGHTDPKFFIGFDMIVLATDSFFMAMFFFLSGAVRIHDIIVRSRLKRVRIQPKWLSAVTLTSNLSAWG